jgi:ATP synthase subunit G
MHFLTLSFRIVLSHFIPTTSNNHPIVSSYWSLGRGDRMKQAKVEAQELIDTYRAEKQEEFNNMVLSKGGSEGSWSTKLQADTNKEIQDLQAQFQKNAQKAVDVLLSKCCEVSLEVPTARVRATQKLAGVEVVMVA